MTSIKGRISVANLQKNDALQSGPDRIRTLFSMATDSSHSVIMGEKVVATLAPSFLFDLPHSCR